MSARTKPDREVPDRQSLSNCYGVLIIYGGNTLECWRGNGLVGRYALPVPEIGAKLLLQICLAEHPGVDQDKHFRFDEFFQALTQERTP